MIEETQLLPRQRVRIHYAKSEAIKFISHHDEFRLWERALRRTGLPLLYKQGFNPQPHIQFAAPLGVGITGANEPLDLILAPPLPLDEIAAQLRAKLPPGVRAAVGGGSTAGDRRAAKPDPRRRLHDHPLCRTGRNRRRRDRGAHRSLLAQRRRSGASGSARATFYTYNLRPLVFELRYVGYDAASEEHRIFLRVQHA
jgi:hypothetical protein